MSSSIYINLDGQDPITAEQFETFCQAHQVIYSPHTVGRNTFYAGDVEISFGKEDYSELPKLPNGRLDFDQARPSAEASKVMFSTYYCGSDCPDVVRLALAFWNEHGGSMEAAPEFRSIMCGPLLQGPTVIEGNEVQSEHEQLKITATPTDN